MTTHEVKQGECMASIAAHYEWPSWRQLYNHADNASLRSVRPDPFTLKAGDLVQIPEQRDWLRRSCVTGKVHVFGHKLPAPLAALIHLRFDMSDPELYANKRYELSVDGEVLEGRTGSDAQLHHAVPLEAKQATLELWLLGDEQEPERWQVDLRQLDPSDTVSGMKGRMINLGLLAHESGSELDDTLDDTTRQALEAFEAERAGKQALERDVGGPAPLDSSERSSEPTGDSSGDPSDAPTALESRARPGFEPGEEYLEVGRSYRLQLVPKPRRVYVRLATAGGHAYAERPYVLEVDGVLHEGTTSADAEIDVQVPASAREAELRVEVEGYDDPEVWTLELDGAQPEGGDEQVEEDTLFIAGLINLGFLASSSSEDTAAVEQATAVFQAVYGLEPNGEIDGPTLARMQRIGG